MKYVVIQEQDGTEFPVFCVAPQSHAQLATAWRRDDTRKVVAAGFCEFLPSGVAIVFGFSHSLNLGTRPKDASLITALYLGTVSMSRARDGGQVLRCSEQTRASIATALALDPATAH